MRLKYKKKYYTTKGDEGGFYEDIKVGFEMEIKPVTLDIMVDMFNLVWCIYLTSHLDDSFLYITFN